MARTVQCIKLGREAEGLDYPPVSRRARQAHLREHHRRRHGQAWLKHQTMLVNENRLSLADLRARKYVADRWRGHFFGGGADQAAGYVPPKP